MHWNILRQWALLGAGALASLTGGIVIGQLGFSWLLTGLLITFFAVFLVLGAGADTQIRHQYHLGTRKRWPRIGILNDMEWSQVGSRTATWTSVSPEQWHTEIERQLEKRGLNVRVCLITTGHNFDPYTAIVNPYGGAYPEKDVVDLHTLNKIFRYVKDRGLFVNVADIPGYWAYNVLLQRRVLAVPPLRSTILQEGRLLVSELPLFSMVPWMQRLGLRVHNTAGDVTTNLSLQVEATFDGFSESRLQPIDVPRVAEIEENMEVLLGHPRTKSGEKIVWGDSYPDADELTPMFFASYGNGEFLVSMLNLDSHQPTSTKVSELIIAALVGRLAQKRVDRP